MAILIGANIKTHFITDSPYLIYQFTVLDTNRSSKPHKDLDKFFINADSKHIKNISAVIINFYLSILQTLIPTKKNFH